MTMFATKYLNIINVYRSSGDNMNNMINDLQGIINDMKNTIIVGDFNLCMIDEKSNAVTNYLKRVGFTQYVTEATHLGGGHIDHVYSNIDTTLFNIDVSLYSPYYTCQDHDALLITIKKVTNGKVKYRFSGNDFLTIAYRMSVLLMIEDLICNQNYLVQCYISSLNSCGLNKKIIFAFSFLLHYD